MANPYLVSPTLLTSDSDLELFNAADIYRYDIDNRPLRKLLLNDQQIATEHDDLSAEVYNARTDAVAFEYANLKTRLDSMDLSSGYPTKLVLFGDAYDAAALLRARMASGFFCRTGDVYDANDVESVWPQGVDPDYHIPYGALIVKTAAAAESSGNPSSTPSNTLWISTQHVSSGSPSVQPLDALVAGFHVRLFNEKANGAAASLFANGISVLLPAPAGSGHRFDFAFLEMWLAPVSKALNSGAPETSFYPYGAVDSNGALTVDLTDPTVCGTVFFYDGNGGDYVQIRHRIRVVSGVDASAHPFGMTDAAVLARGGAGSPVAGKTFSNGVRPLGDGSSWRAGAGDSGDKTALGSVDGYVYAMPIALVSRRNTTNWSLTNQEGSGTTHPAGLTATDFVRGDIVDLRPRAATDRAHPQQAADETFDRILRGQLRSVFGRLAYDDSDDFDRADLRDAYGTELMSVDYIANAKTAHTNAVLDLTDAGYVTADPDGIRRVWSPTGDTQTVGFHIPVSGSPSPTPAGFGAINGGTHVVTLTAGASGSGKIITSVPVMSWRTTKASVATVSGWSGIGTRQATATLATGDGFYDGAGVIDGAVYVQQPPSTGIRNAPNRVDYQDYLSPVSALVPTTRTRGLNLPTGLMVDGSGNIYVCDTYNHRVIKYDSSGAKLGQFGVTGVSGSDNSHLLRPNAVAVDGSGNIYVADSGNHRVVKLSPSLPTFTYTAQFGTTGTPGVTNVQLQLPCGVAVDGSGNVYISDNENYRILKLDSSLVYQAQFGVNSVSGQDTTHTLSPVGANIGEDGNLYIADRTRILIIDPSDMSLVGIIAGGEGVPEGVAASTLAGIRTVATAQDSAGNIYVAGGGTSAVYKFDSGLNLLATFGNPATPWTGDTAASTTLVGRTYAIAVDAADASVWISDAGTDAPLASRMLILNSSDLSFKYQKVWANPRPWMDGSAGGYPVAPYPPYPAPWVQEMALDTAGKNFYLPINTLSVVEKWAYTNDNPSTWTYQGRFGDLTNTGQQWVGWRNSSDNSSRLAHPNCCSFSGAYLFVGDNQVLGGGNFSGRVVRISPTVTDGRMAYSAQYGDIAALNGDVNPLMNYVSGIVAATDLDRVYVADAQSNPARLIVLKFSGGDWNSSGSAGAMLLIKTDASWPSARVSNAFLSVNGINYARNGLYINPGDFTQFWTIVASPNYLTRALFAPGSVIQYRTQSHESLKDVRQMWQSDDALIFSDDSTNLLYAMSVPDYYPIGRAGTPGVSSFGLGGWCKTTGVAYDGTYLYLCDLFNNHVVKASAYYAYVERGSGRIETLFAPPIASQIHVYSRSTPYQGVATRPTLLAETNHLTIPLFASRFVAVPQRVLTTTRGRVGIERGGLHGDSAYANPLAHLPWPSRAGTEYSWPGNRMRFAGNVLDPTDFALLPIVQSASDPLTYGQDSESVFEPDTQIAASLAALTPPARGATTRATYNDAFPSLRSFNLAEQTRHLCYAYGVIEYCGELLLFVRGDLVDGVENGVALQTQTLPSASDVVELYRLHGQPFAKFYGSR